MSEPRIVELYGLAVSAPVPLQGWPLPIGTSPDVVVRFEARPTDAALWDEAEAGERIFTSESPPGGLPGLIAERFGRWPYLRLRYAEGMRFHVSLDGGEVWADWEPPMTAADAVTFLLGPIFGVVLRQRGVLPLHASAVVLDGRAWAFVGPGGAGKSTLAAAFAVQGAPVLTEDVLALRRGAGGGWTVAPAYGEIRLWDEAATLLAPVPPALPVLSPTWPKRGLDLRAHGLPFARRAAPLGGLFVLDEARAGETDPWCAPLGAADGLLELVANAYVNYLAPPSALALELVDLSGLARLHPILQLRPGEGREGIARTVARVREVVRGRASREGDAGITP